MAITKHKKHEIKEFSESYVAILRVRKKKEKKNPVDGSKVHLGQNIVSVETRCNKNESSPYDQNSTAVWNKTQHFY